MAIERPSIKDGSTERKVIDISNHIFTVVFTIEMCIKVCLHCNEMCVKVFLYCNEMCVKVFLHCNEMCVKVCLNRIEMCIKVCLHRIKMCVKVCLHRFDICKKSCVCIDLCRVRLRNTVGQLIFEGKSDVFNSLSTFWIFTICIFALTKHIVGLRGGHLEGCGRVNLTNSTLLVWGEVTLKAVVELT